MEPRTLADLLKRSCRKWKDNVAMLVPEGGDFRKVTYAEMYETIRAYAGVLRGLGVSRGSRMVILSENCPEWFIADLAGQSLGAVVVPIYPTLPADQARYIVNDSGATVVLTGSGEQWAKAQGMDRVRVIPLKDGAESVDAQARSVDPAGDGGLSMEEWEAEMDAIGPEDLATIIYTSGTTGVPKGAMIPHQAFAWVSEAVIHNLPFSADDTFLSFLPMSHVFERIDGQILPMSLGSTIGYSKSLMSLAGDMQKVRPTVMLVVPRFLEATREKILDGVRKQPALRQRIFHLGLEQGRRKFRGEFAPLFGLTDKLVGAKIRERIGGRLRFFVAGGAALPTAVAEFYGAFGLKILQGYGLTETSGGVVVNHPDRNKYHAVGEVLPGMECRLAQDGEILFRGPAVMQGYYHLPDETAQAIDEEGWFHTGDIGEWEGTYLKITDRKKDILVLGNGKNVAPQPIENKLKGSQFISEAVLFGDGREHCVALIVPNHEAVRAELSVPESQPLSESKEARALVKREIDSINKTLANFEMVKGHVLLDRPFTIESGEMTPTLKVKRKVVRERYADLIEGLYR
jgi:long-chain acyl-CoA synthetase